MRSHRARESQWPEEIDPSRCQTPEKVSFGSRNGAKRVLSRWKPEKRQQLEVYRCECNAWHIGSKAYRPGRLKLDREAGS